MAKSSFENYDYNAAAGSAVITEEVEIRGDLAFAGQMHFNGRFEGNIISDGSIFVGEQALIKGSVSAETAEIAGKIGGQVITRGQAHLKSTAMIFGDVTADKLTMEEGAQVKGKVIITGQQRQTDDFNGLFRRVGKTER